MRIVSAKLFNKLGNTELTKIVNGRLEQPRIIAKNWYHINTNKRLAYNLIIHGMLILLENLMPLQLREKAILFSTNKRVVSIVLN